LLEAIDVLIHVEGLTFVHFDESDVVRHHLVQRIIRAYDERKTQVAEQQMLLLAAGKNSEGSPMKATDAVKSPEGAGVEDGARKIPSSS